ncbi:MAG: endo-1,4-beta-xylanase [Acidimicrobiia bacterium]|nr:endo-1,4-beta-xylanase [Acidimicrobiia bacterium]
MRITRTTRRERVTVACLAAIAVVAASCSQSGNDAETGKEPDGAEAAETAETAQEACADGDCPLWQAGELVGVHVGFLLPQDGAEPGTRIGLEEGNLMATHFFSWAETWPERDRPDWEVPAEHYEFALANDMDQAAYHFAWDQEFLDDLPSFPDPGWVQSITDPAELREVLRTRARELFERYPEIDKINVINEPLPTLGQSDEIYQNHFYEVLGPDYIVELFQIVDEEAPESVDLVLNENYVEYFPVKADGLVKLVRDLVAAGAPIDSVGFQGHLMFTELLDREPDFDLLRVTMEEVADLGVDVWISELDNPVDPAREDRFEYQADNYRKVVETCLSVSRCTDILIWGVTDERPLWNHPLTTGFVGYEEADALLFDESGDPKPAYFAVRDALLEGRPETDEGQNQSPSSTRSS